MYTVKLQEALAARIYDPKWKSVQYGMFMYEKKKAKTCGESNFMFRANLTGASFFGLKDIQGLEIIKEDLNHSEDQAFLRILS